MTVAGAVLPLLSTLLGAGITYLVNVRQRRRNYIEDLFNEAIAAVAAARASTRFVSAADPRRADLEGDDLREFDRQFKRLGLETEARKLSEALEALAKLTPYLPAVAVYYQDADGPERIFAETDRIIELLRDGLREVRHAEGVRGRSSLRARATSIDSSGTLAQSGSARPLR